LVVVHTGGALEHLPPEDGGGVDRPRTTALDKASFAGEQPRAFWVEELLPVARRLAGSDAGAPSRSRLGRAAAASS
jgi:hypothetical protein